MRKFQVAKVPRSESSRELKFQGAKVPHLELSLSRANGLGSENSSYLVFCSTAYRDPRVVAFSGPTLVGTGKWNFHTVCN